MRYTERRPDLYEHSLNIAGNCEIVLDISDTGTSTARILHFGQKLPDDIKKPDWLWIYRGRVKIISTKFHKGVHYASCPEQYLPIVAHLKALHQGGFVHGDIRAYNMVLSYDSKNKPNGKLIDFDYGGEILTNETIEDNALSENDNGYQNPKYPSGYVDQLEDGSRLGRPGEAITAFHDWFALGRIIFGLYNLRHPKIVSTKIFVENEPLSEEQKQILEQETRLSYREKAFSEMQGDYTSLNNDPGKVLERYLILAQKNGFQLVPTYEFNRSLQKCNMLKSGDPRIDSKGATGSPPKPK